MSEERQALLRAYAPAASASASKRSMAHLQSPSPPSSPSQAQLLLESEEAHSLALGRAVERRLSSLRSMTVIATLLFVFSTSVMALGTTEFNSSDTRHWFVALLSVAVTLSAYALLTYLVHAAVCDRLVAEGVPEYAWRLLVKTFLIRLSRRLADIALVLSMTFFVLLAFLKASDNLSGDYIHHLLIMLGVGLVVLFGVMTTPLVFMYYRRP